MWTHRKILTLTRRPPSPQTPSHARTRPRPLPHSLLSARPSLCDSAPRPSLCDSARGLLPSPSSAATPPPPSPSTSTRRARPLSFTPGSGQIHGGRAPRWLDLAPPSPRRWPHASSSTPAVLLSLPHRWREDEAGPHPDPSLPPPTEQICALPLLLPHRHPSPPPSSSPAGAPPLPLLHPARSCPPSLGSSRWLRWWWWWPAAGRGGGGGPPLPLLL